MRYVTASLLDRADGEDLLRHAADEADEVRVVDVQIDRGAAGLGGVADVRGPVGLGDDALEVRRRAACRTARRESPRPRT